MQQHAVHDRGVWGHDPLENFENLLPEIKGGGGGGGGGRPHDFLTRGGGGGGAVPPRPPPLDPPMQVFLI